MQFDRLQFADALKHFRKKYQYSQDSLAELLSSSHRVFSSLNQATLSQWERQKIEPTLLRRLGIAHFFQQPYHYDSQELKVVKKALQHPVNSQNLSTVYDYEITHTGHVPFEKLEEEDRALVIDSHLRMNGGDIIDTLNQLELNQPKIYCFYYRKMLVGHVVYEQKNNSIYLVSVVFLNKSIRTQILNHIAGISRGLMIYFPIRDHSLSQFMEGCFLERCCSNHSITFYTGASRQFFENPMIKSVLQGFQDFRLVRYEQMLKSKAFKPAHSIQ
ncbi:transcriptional regulator [Vibrio campbellii]|uniref:helix-turn-helix domain-containing protein n=1 Tax=Vibrio campbellii TaxID=680 RepID=UPI000CF38767|nr:helix-turn-helix transcriptional regulator [Vibrio campbellii]PQJ43742.1 transcriptional regulator [Vibrio campbellii]